MEGITHSDGAIDYNGMMRVLTINMPYQGETTQKTVSSSIVDKVLNYKPKAYVPLKPKTAYSTNMFM
ncbi:MAG: hypothetical protein AB7V77_04605 [Candidatus Woesearchaeota archaeon]